MQKTHLWTTAIAVMAFAFSSWAQDDEAEGVADQAAYMAPKVTESMLLDGAIAGDKHVVVGERGHVIVSADDGKTWKQSSVPTRSTLNGVYFVGPNNGWAVGHDAVILRTQDGGANWRKVHFNPDGQTPLLDVWFADAQNGIAIGAYGLYLETDDGGETWTRRPLFSTRYVPPVDPDAEKSDDEDEGNWYEDEDEYVDPDLGEEFHLNHITAADDGTLYMAAESGHFYRSDDGGKSWLSLPTDYQGSYFATIPLADGAILLAGMQGNLYYSSNKGLELEQTDSGVEALLGDGYVTANGQILIAGMAGILLEGDADGQSFTNHSQSDRKGNIAVLPAKDGAIILIGEAGVKRLSAAQYKAGGR